MDLGVTLERAVAVALGVSTLAVATVVVEGRVRSPQPKDRSHTRYIEEWTAIERESVRLGAPNPAVDIIVFTDFQCPFCRHMDSVLTRVEEQYGGKAARSVVHFPLPMHSQARPAGAAFECATRQGMAVRMHNTLYAAQDSLGSIPWMTLATRAGVPNLRAFANCLASPETQARIDAGVALGRQLAINGTPAVLVNGWLIEPPIPASVEQAIANAIKGGSPGKR